MLSEAAVTNPLYALLPADSFAVARTTTGRQLIDSLKLAAAVQRARGDALTSARSWVASQPMTLRAHGAMVNAYVGVRNYPAALAEVERFREATPLHPELPFVQARIQFASGEIDRAAAQLRTALDTVAPKDFQPYQGTTTVLADIAAAANVFAYQGDLDNAAKAIDLADQVRREVLYEPGWMAGDLKGESWRRAMLGELYAAAGGPAAEKRKHLVHTGATAAIGLFTGLAADSTALTELRAISGETPSKEVRALLAVSRGDSAAARRALAEPDSTAPSICTGVTAAPTRPRPTISWATMRPPFGCWRGSSPPTFIPEASMPAGVWWGGSGCFAVRRTSGWADWPKPRPSTGRS